MPVEDQELEKLAGTYRFLMLNVFFLKSQSNIFKIHPDHRDTIFVVLDAFIKLFNPFINSVLLSKIFQPMTCSFEVFWLSFMQFSAARLPS